MTPIAEVLLTGYEVFSGPGTWTQGPAATDAEGWGVTTDNVAACRWCLIGAVFEAAEHDSHKCTAARAIIREVIFGWDVGFNEQVGRKQEEVCEAFRRAYELALKRGL